MKQEFLFDYAFSFFLFRSVGIAELFANNDFMIELKCHADKRKLIGRDGINCFIFD